MKVFLDGNLVAEIDNKDILSNLAEEYEVGVSDFVVVLNKQELNVERNKELKGFIVSNIFMNEDIIKMMAVQHNIAEADDVIEWIDINNQTVTFNKAEFGALIKAGSQKVKEIYFKYRALKNELEEA